LIFRKLVQRGLSNQHLIRNLVELSRQAPLYANASYLVLASGATAFLGFLFWVLVARLYSPDDVGFASAVISAVNLLGFLSNLGLNYGLVRFLPESGDRTASLLNSTFILGAVIAAITGSIFLVGIPIWSPALDEVRGNFVYVVCFLGSLISMVVQTMINAAFVSYRKSVFVLLQGALTSGLRIIIALGLVTFLGALGIFASWALAIQVALIVSVLLLVPRIRSGYKPALTIDILQIKSMFQYSFQNYLTMLFWNGPNFVLPLIVVNLVGAESTAYFFMAITMAGLVWTIPTSVSLSLLAEGSHDEKSIPINLRRSVKINAALAIPAIIFLVVFGDKFLLAFGGEYSLGATRTLQLLAITAIPVSVNFLYLGVRRAQKRMKGPIMLTGFIACASLIGSYFVLPTTGILGVGVALFLSNSIAASWVVIEFVREKGVYGNVSKSA